MFAGFYIGKYRASRAWKEVAPSLKGLFLYYIKKAKALNKDSRTISDAFYLSVALICGHSDGGAARFKGTGKDVTQRCLDVASGWQLGMTAPPLRRVLSPALRQLRRSEQRSPCAHGFSGPAPSCSAGAVSPDPTEAAAEVRPPAPSGAPRAKAVSSEVKTLLSSEFRFCLLLFSDV